MYFSSSQLKFIFSIIYSGLLLLNEFLDIFWLFRKFKIYVVIEWCIDVLNEVCNDVKVWLKYSIFRKENTVLRFFLWCIYLSGPNPMRRSWLYWYNGITWMKVFSWWESMGVHMTLSAVWNIIWFFRSYEFTMSYKMMR